MINNAKSINEIREILNIAWEDDELESYGDLLEYVGLI